MARGVNKVILIGNLGDEPLCRSTHSGCSVTNISMVTNEVRRNIDTGESTEYAEWHRVVMWGKLADIAKQYLHKGSQIYVEGKLRTRTFLDKQGQKRSVTEIVADEMQMLGGRPPMQPGMMNQSNTNSYRSNRGMNPNGGYGAPVAGGTNNPMFNRVNSSQNSYGNMGQMPNQMPYGNDNDLGGMGSMGNMGNMNGMGGMGNIYSNPLDNDAMDLDDDMLSQNDSMNDQDDMSPAPVMKDGNANNQQKQEASLEDDALPF